MAQAGREGVTPDDHEVDAWAEATLLRHMASLTRLEFLKAVRALSARYVEKRSDLPHRSPVDSAGKRAAFAGFFAPLHFYTVRSIAGHQNLGGAADSPDAPHRIVDLGCGTGVSSAACAWSLDRAPVVEGIDRLGWSLSEASWNWRRLGVRARTRRGDLVGAAERMATRRQSAADRALLVLGWTVNELTPPDRLRLLRALLSLVEDRTDVLVIEPISHAATPWWGEWSSAWREHGAREDTWSLAVTVPASLREIDTAAGFRRDTLSAKTLYAIGREA
jgi:hypothetical protein